MKAVVYTRVSTDEQTKNLSLETATSRVPSLRSVTDLPLTGS